MSSQAQTLEDVGRELAEARVQLAAIKAKPVRAFRGRRLEHGPLRVSITPVEEVGDVEVYVEHRGDSLVILVGAAAVAARGGQIVRLDQPAPATYAAPAMNPGAQQLGGIYRPMTQADIKAIQMMTDVSQAIAYGAQFGLDADAASALAVGNIDMTTGLVPPELLAGPPNVTLQMQTDPSKPGGWQDRSEAAAVAQRFSGYTGLGPRPPNWVDPDAAPAN